MNNNATTTSSSSTAAAANSASAPTTSKPGSNNQMGNAAPSINSVKATRVKLLIVASNQQLADQLIEGDMLWSVKQLKSHLSMVYPNKPPILEQKIIYSGKLLKNEQLLKDIIRIYKDVPTANHVFHLVYTPKNVQYAPNFMQKPNISNATSIRNNLNANTVNADGQRHDNIPRAADATEMPMQHQHQHRHPHQHQHPHPHQHQHQSQQQQLNRAQPQLQQFAGRPQNASSNPSNAMPFGMVGQPTVQAMVTQQLVLCNWIQQVYSQYMEEYMRRSNCNATGVGNTPTTPIALPPILVGALAMNPFAQQLLFISLAGVGATATTDLVRSVPSTLLAAQAQLSSAFNTIGETNLVNEPAPAPTPTQTPAPRPASALTPLAIASASAPTPARALAPAAAPAPAPAPAPASSPAPAPARAPARAAAPVPAPAPAQAPALARELGQPVVAPGRNRTSLDTLFLMTRIALFVSVVLVNTSPLRCLGVFLIISVMCFLQNRPDRNNNINVRANIEGIQIRRGVQQAAQVAQQQIENLGAADGAGEPAMPAIVGVEAASIENTNTNNGNQPPSVLSVVRTFVVTFFTSILPQAPPN